MASRQVSARLARKGASFARREDGFSLIESIMGMMLFAFIAVALAGLLQSSIRANDLSRNKTVGQQLAQDQVEDIRRLDYDNVGLVGGNPPGTVLASRTTTFRGFNVTIATQIQYVNDPTPTSYATAANYKKVTVTVTDNRNGRVLTTVVTYVAPPSRAPYGGVNNAIINITAKDLQTSQPLGGAAVALTTGPSAPRNDTTDATTGLVTFAGLTPNPTSGGNAYYDIGVTKSGYETYVDYISPAAPAHVQLAPSQTLDTEILLYRPITITVQLLDVGGSPYSGTATVRLSSERSGTTETFTATGGSTPGITTFAGRPTAPGNFTARAYASADGLCAEPVTQLAWDTYPATLASVITLQLEPCPTIDVTATWAGLPVWNVGGTATVTVTGGAFTIPSTTITDPSGTISIPVPALAIGDPPYQVQVSKNGGSDTTPPTVSTLVSGGSAPVNVALTPVKTLTLTIQAPSGTNIPNQPITVSLTDGPNGSPNVQPAYQSPPGGNTNGSSRVVLQVPVQSTGTYTVKVYRTNCPGSTNRSRTTTVSAAAGTTSATIALNTSTCPITTP